MADDLLPKADISVRLNFPLPARFGDRCAVRIWCGVAHIHQSTRDSCHLGMKFVAIESGGDELKAYLESRTLALGNF